jgi:serpin B
MKSYSIVLMLALCAVLSQCKSAKEPVTDKSKPEPEITVGAVPDSLLIRGNTAFALDLYSYIRSDSKNVFFSPYSISTALAMTYAGARGESESQMSKVMHFDPKQSQFHPRYHSLINYISGLNQGDSLTLTTAQAMFAQKDFPFLENYINLVKLNYSAGLEMVDFKANVEQARQYINTWVAQHTNNRIENLIAQGMINELARLVLVNTIYFKASWNKAFNPADNTTGSFFITPEHPVKAMFMNREAEFLYKEETGLQVLSIPYIDSTMTMTIFLPQDVSAMEKTEQKLKSPEDLKSLIGGMSMKKVNISIPRFKMNSEFELSDVLKKMGMPHPFSDQADFSGMTGKKDLLIDKVIHKAFIEVSEKGTEASAATAVIIRLKSNIVTRFIANRPFLFVITDTRYNNLLFMGRLNNPVAENQ